MTTAKMPTLYIPYKHSILVAILAIMFVAIQLFPPKVNERPGNSPLTAPSPSAEALGLEALGLEALGLEALGLEALGPETLVLETQGLETQDLEKQYRQPSLEAPIITQPESSPVIESILSRREDRVVIGKGDTLSTLFDQYDLGQKTLRHILSADESLLALETLKLGQVLFFRYSDDAQTLEEMELFIHPGHRVVYQRSEAGDFSYEVIQQDGEWHHERINGSIEGSFYVSALRAGLTDAETTNITRIFNDQLNFARTIRRGDQFQVVRKVQTVDGQLTGQTVIESARIQRKRFEHTAFLFEDGRYYDKDGNGLARAFTRTPLAKRYRISSSFNPRRRHPITGRVSPHNGTDFATPIGTQVLSTGDGVVKRIGHHRFAGRYVDIQHGGQYKTRYLHLHKILVRRGQDIKRGQAIALSGNSGRSTGAHLHFELHVNGRPVNPMTAKIPISQSVPKENRQTFAKTVALQTQRLDGLLDDRSEPTKLAMKGNGTEAPMPSNTL